MKKESAAASAKAIREIRQMIARENNPKRRAVLIEALKHEQDQFAFLTGLSWSQ